MQLDGDKLVTDSLTVAKTFGKEQETFLRAFDNLKCSLTFNRRNFVPVEYRDEKSEMRRLIKMIKDDFMMQVMGFTRKAAMAFEEAYIAAFDAMAAYIAQHQQSLWQRIQALIAKEPQSKVKASYGSHLMLARKRGL